MTASSKSTTERILDAAESLFAQHGIGAVSLRKIIAAADVNLAAVHYHFGSKEELIRAVFQRRIVEVNRQRLDLLNELRSRHGAGPIPLEDLLRAFLLPAVQLGQSRGDGGAQFFRLVARAHAETDSTVQRVLFEQFKDIVIEFIGEFERTLPGVSAEGRLAQLAFVVGAMVQAVLLPAHTAVTENFAPGGFDKDWLVQMLIDFCRGGMAAGVPQ